MTGASYLPLAFLLLLPGATEGAKILLLTVPVGSQCLMAAAIGQELKSRGHDVTVYFPDRHDPGPCFGHTKVAIRKFPITPEQARVIKDGTQKMSKAVFEGSGGPFEFFKLMKGMIVSVCNPLLSSDLQGLKGEGYDLVIMTSNPPMRCMSYVPLYLGVPFVSLGALVDPFDSLDPFPGYYKGHVFLNLPDTSTFPRRFLSSLTWLASRLVFTYLGGVFERGVTTSVPFDPNAAARRASLFLEVQDHVLLGPRATFPNVVEVGALTARPPQPLTPDLEAFFKGARRGVLVVAFGSILRSVPEGVVQRLMEALRRVEYKVLMSWSEDREEGNVKMVKWIPQNDVLGHAGTRAFLSHCGLGSFSEAVYHGVPILCSPLNSDAFLIADRVVSRGIGLKIDIRVDSSDVMLAALKTTLESPDIRANMTRTSALLRDRPEAPAARAATAVEHVIKYGGDHLRPEVDLDLGVMGYLLLDVWAAMLGIVCAVVAMVTCLCRCLCCRKKHAAAGGSAGEKKKKTN